MYLNENGNRYPYVADLPDPTMDNPAKANWFNKLEPYYPLLWTNPAYHCPGYKGAIDAPTIFPPPHDPFGSYAYNWRGVRGYRRHSGAGEINLGLGMPQYDTARHPRRQEPAISDAQVKAPSEMFAIGESRFRQETKIFNNADCVSGMFCGYPSNHNGSAITFPLRHGKNYNELYCDGHVGAMDPWILFNPANTAAMWNNDHQPHPEYWPPEW